MPIIDGRLIKRRSDWYLHLQAYIEALQPAYFDGSTAARLDSKAARRGSGRAVQHTLCELEK
jgi:hypothetical protein